MDKRISYKIVIDTETCPLDKNFEGVDPFNMFVYDIGYAVVDKRGRVYRTRNFVVKEIFNNEKELMKSAYYAEKLVQYREEIANGVRTVASLYEIRKTLTEDIKEFGVEQVFAHNMRFDYNSLNNTQRWLTKSKYRYFIPYGLEICDTLKMARQVVAPMPTYKRFCERNGLVTKNGKPQLKAETIYRFLKQDLTFVEKHTGLEDVMIEKEILAYCYRQHKKMERKLWARA